MVLVWISYVLMTVSLVGAVVLKGGVYPQHWEWSALGISIAAALLLVRSRKDELGRQDGWGLKLMAVLLGWMALQMIPLPPTDVAWLSPERWTMAHAARIATGMEARLWLSLSVAPAATMARLLDVVSAMAAFVAARELAWIWRDRPWLVVAPVVGIAWLESVLGLAQFYLMRLGGAEASSATGTYVNRNHFAGLLEMVFPLTIFWAVSVWRRGTTRHARPAGPAIMATVLLGIAACLLMGVVVSLSKMGFLSTLAAGLLTALVLLASKLRGEKRAPSFWRLAASGILFLCALVFLPTKEMIGRFAEMAANENVSKQMRLDIWRDTFHLVGAYKWTGCGLGAFERGLFLFKTVAPTNRVDFAHNDYLQIVAELGGIGGTLAFTLATWILYRALSVALWMPGVRNWELALGLLGALLALGLHSLTDFNIYIPANALVLAWLSGVADSPGLRMSG